MSAKVVTPARICSAAASRVPQRTNSSVTFFASAGKMYFRNHSSSVTSSCSPRKRVIGTCVCPLMNPGSTNFPLALMVCGAAYLLSISARGPSARIASPFTTTAPSSRMRRCPSIVTMVPPLTSRSTFSFFAVCAWRPAENRKWKTETRATACHEWDLRIHFHFSFFLQIGGIKRFRKQLAHGDDFGFALQIREDHRYVAAKFPDQLAAGTARRRKRIRVRHHGDGVEAALSFADRFENGDAFSANGEAVRGVFDVAASENPARSGAKGGTNPKIGVRRMRVLARLFCRRNQNVILAHAFASRHALESSGNDFRDSRKQSFQQSDELPFHALRRLKHFFVIQRLVQNSRGRIRHAGNSEHANSAVPRRNDFRHRGHSHKIRANRSKIPYLCRRFVARTGQRGVHPFVHSDAYAVSFPDSHLAKSAVVSAAHIRKSRAKSLVIGT